MNKVIPALVATIIAGALALSGASVASAIDSTPITPGGTSSPSTSTSPVNTPAPTLPSTIPLKASAASGQSSTAAVTVPLTVTPTSSSSPTPGPSALPAASPVVSPSKVNPSPKPIAIEVPTLVLWEKPANTFGPQHVVATKSTADLNALDADALAGHCYQADLYHPSDTTGNLLEGGTLIAPGNPKEDLLPGGAGVAYKTWCVPVPVVPTVQRCGAITSGGTATDLNANGWSYTESRSTGHNDYVVGGLHVYTEGSKSTDKAAGYHALGIPLKLIGTPALELASATGGPPGMNLAISLHGDGVWNGIIVNEGNSYGPGMWWTSKTTFGVPAGGGYPSLGTLNQYLSANPNATVLYGGYSLGSGVLGNVLIKSETMGCKKYTFDVAPTPVTLPTPVTAAVVQSTPVHEALAFTGPTPLAHATQVALLLSGIILLGAGIPMTIAVRKRARRQE